jgi:hypothetical protein
MFCNCVRTPLSAPISYPSASQHFYRWHCRIQEVQPEYEKYYKEKAKAKDPNVKVDELEVPDPFRPSTREIVSLPTLHRDLNAHLPVTPVKPDGLREP